MYASLYSFYVSVGSKRVQFTAKSAASGYEDVAFENPVADVDNVIIENLDNEFYQRSYDASIIEVHIYLYSSEIYL